MALYESTPHGAVASYMPATEGPFRCDRCEYQERLQCRRPEVVTEAKQLRGLDWHAKTVTVEAAACCNFFEKMR